MSYTARLAAVLLFTGITFFSCKKKDDDKSVVPPPPDPTPAVAAFSYTTAAWKVTFTSTSANNPDTLAWDFGDGSTDTGQQVMHTYANPGSYIVSLRAANADGSSVYKDTIVLKERIIEITTTFGKMYMYLYNQTPLHRNNFLKLAEEGFFDSTTFHRIVPNFVIQGGDPNSKDSDTTNDGYGGPGYDIDFSAPPELKHIYGAVGAASEGAKGPSSGSQFYIVVNPAGTPFLNGNYTVFGFIMKGMDVAQQIVSQPRNADDRPFTDIRMKTKVLEKTKEQILADYGYVVP